MPHPISNNHQHHQHHTTNTKPSRVRLLKFTSFALVRSAREILGNKAIRACSRRHIDQVLTTARQQVGIEPVAAGTNTGDFMVGEREPSSLRR